MAELTVNYPPRVGAEGGGAEALLAAWWRVLDSEAAKGWLTDAVFDRAIVETLRAVTGFMPSVGDFLAFCRLARSALEDEAERETRKRLPPPAPVPDAWAAKTSAQRRAFWDRNVAIGKARARKRFALIEAARRIDPRARPHIGAADCEPTDAEIQAVLQEMAEGSAHRGPLAGVLEQVSVGPPYRTARDLAAHLPVVRDPAVSEAMAALNDEGTVTPPPAAVPDDLDSLPVADDVPGNVAFLGRLGKRNGQAAAPEWLGAPG